MQNNLGVLKAGGRLPTLLGERESGSQPSGIFYNPRSSRKRTHLAKGQAASQPSTTMYESLAPRRKQRRAAPGNITCRIRPWEEGVALREDRTRKARGEGRRAKPCDKPPPPERASERGRRQRRSRERRPFTSYLVVQNWRGRL